jgi:hypothetical protein
VLKEWEESKSQIPTGGKAENKSVCTAEFSKAQKMAARGCSEIGMELR